MNFLSNLIKGDLSEELMLMEREIPKNTDLAWCVLFWIFIDGLNLWRARKCRVTIDEIENTSFPNNYN